MKENNSKKVVQKNEIKTVSGLTIKVAYKSASSKKLMDSGVITEEDAEMDKRARAAIEGAIKKKKILNKPITVYDVKCKKTYLEYANGERKEVKI